MKFQNMVTHVNQPWAMVENNLGQMLKVFDGYLNKDILALDKVIEEKAFFSSEKSIVDAWELKELANGIVEMTIDGTFVPKTYGLNPYCGMVPTQGIEKVIQDLESAGTQTLIMKVSSAGGAVTGVPELVKTIKNSSMKTIAFIDELACSAGYWVASTCDHVFATQSAMIGSIGVYIAITKRNTENSSYKTNYFSAGEKKLYGASNIPLTESEAKSFQDSVNQTYDWFCSDVASNRNVSLEEVKKTEAGVYRANQAEWLVDEVTTYNELITTLQEM